MELLDKLNSLSELVQEIYDYFQYPQSWKVYPLDNGTKYYWKIDDGIVLFAEDPKSLKEELHEYEEDMSDEEFEDFEDLCDRGTYYENEILTEFHLKKSIFEGKDYTMILVDTHTDGNQFLQIFDNDKRIE